MTEFEPKTYRNAEGRERRVTSQEGAVAAEWDGFYDPQSPSGKALSASRAAETRKANASRATATKRTATKRAAKKQPAKEPAAAGRTNDDAQASAEAAAAAATPTA